MIAWGKKTESEAFRWGEIFFLGCDREEKLTWEARLRGRVIFGCWLQRGRGGSLRKRSWFVAKKTLDGNKHCLVRLFGFIVHYIIIPLLSLLHVIILHCLWVCFDLVIVVSSHVSLFFFIQRWSNCALIGCFIFENLLVSWFFLEIF